MKTIVCLLLVAIAPAITAADPHHRPPPPAAADGPGALLPGGLLFDGALVDRLRAAPPGSWVEYVATLQGQPVGSYLRYVYAGPSEEGVWLELWLSARPGSAATAFQLLLGAGAAGRAEVKRVRQRLLGGEPSELELPPTEAAPAPTTGARRSEARWTTVMTRAGSFRAREVALRDGAAAGIRLYLAEELPLFGLARMDLQGGAGLELHGFGHEGRLAFGPPEPAARGAAAAP